MKKQRGTLLFLLLLLPLHLLLPLPPSPPPQSPLASGEGGKLGEGLWSRNRIKLQKNLGRKIISGLDLICQHAVIVHFDFGKKWNLGLGLGWGGVGGAEGFVSGGGGVASLKSSTHRVRGCSLRLNILLQPKQIMLLQPFGQPDVLPERHLVVAAEL